MANSFTLEDIRLLEKTTSIRERVLDNLTKAELPTSSRDLEAFTGLVDSIDRSIFTKAKISIDEANNKINEGSKDILRDLLLELHKSNSPVTDRPATGNVPTFTSTGMQLKEGELISKTDTTDVNQFLEINTQ